ncbi:hypothetical protein EV130_104380 [Rhizobium azibense]|uniref:Uncharacterized protein n=1 Tax=Rhizobium azibense TaxID=1136135 RepID=A0A4R3QZ70_9HYPH|nr:hypothetical protein EV130_104380 [Rhizobium azibense]
MAEVLSGEAPAPEKQVTVPLRRGRARLRRLASRRRSYSFQQQTTNRPWPIGAPMRSSLKHLPEEQQRELACGVVLVGCSSGQKTSTVPLKRSAGAPGGTGARTAVINLRSDQRTTLSARASWSNPQIKRSLALFSRTKRGIGRRPDFERQRDFCRLNFSDPRLLSLIPRHILLDQPLIGIHFRQRLKAIDRAGFGK